MKVKKILLLLVLTLMLALGLAACNDVVEDPNDTSGTIVNLNKIVVTGINQLDYISGEQLDISNAKLLLEYDNHEVERIPLLENMIPDYEKFALAKSGAFTVNVVYKNCSTSFDVNIYDSQSVSLSWNTKPDKDVFTERTPLSLKGAVLEMKFKSGTSRLIKDIENLVQVNGYDNTTIGNQTITVSYAGYTLDLEIIIVEKEPISIEVSQMPLRTDYFIGNELELKGMHIKVIFNNDTSTVLDFDEDIEGDGDNYIATFDSSKANSYSKVGFTYRGCSTSFYVKVRHPAFQKIELIDAPVTTGILTSDGRTDPTPINDMVVEDKIDYSTGKVKVTFDDDSFKEFKMSDNIIGKSGFVENQTGEFYIRIYYEGNPEQGLDILAKVYKPTPIEMILNPEDVADLQSLSFYKGSIIEEARIEYIGYSIKYNNGNVTEGHYLDPTRDILQGNLTCSTAGEKTIVFSFGQITSVTASITINVIDIFVQSIRIVREPVNTFIQAGTGIIIDGGQLEVTYNDRSRRIINFEDPNEDIILSCEATPDYNDIVGEHTIKVSYLGFYDEYQVEVKDVVVKNITISDFGQTKYMQNDRLNLDGIALYVGYSDSTNDTVAVTGDMLFENHNLYFNGTHYFTRVPGEDQKITLRYGGVTVQYSIDVDPLLIDRIELLRAPKLVYSYGIDTEIDLTNIVVKLYYNHLMEDGSEITSTADYEEIMSNPNWSRGLIDFTTPGKKSYGLFYTLQGETTSLLFSIQVIEKQLISIELENPISDNVPLNMDLNLEGINLILNFDDDIPESIPLLKSYTDYDPKDVTPGERVVTIHYGGFSITQTITLSDKRLIEVTIDTLPRSNFVIGEELDLSSGYIRREFSDDSEDLIAMSDLSVKVSGYDPNIYIGSNGYETQTITITYLTYSMNIELRTYKKLQPSISISGNSVFYGSGIGPEVSLIETIDDFVLPDYTYQYKIGDHWQTELPTQVGSYRIKVIVEGNIYYEGGEFEQTEYFTIVPKHIYITPLDATKVAGSSDPEFTYTIEEDAMLEGDVLTGSLSRQMGELPGNYQITLGTLGNPNYTITLGVAYLTITAS